MLKSLQFVLAGSLRWEENSKSLLWVRHLFDVMTKFCSYFAMKRFKSLDILISYDILYLGICIACLLKQILILGGSHG